MITVFSASKCGQYVSIEYDSERQFVSHPKTPAQLEADMNSQMGVELDMQSNGQREVVHGLHNNPSAADLHFAGSAAAAFAAL